LRKNEVIEVVVKKLAEIVDSAGGNFDMSGSAPSSYSILRRRIPAPIRAPLLQAGTRDCPHIPEFTLPEVALAFFRDSIVTSTGAVIVAGKYLIEETVEGDFVSNGFQEKDGRLQFDDTHCEYYDQNLVNFSKLGIFNHSIFMAEMAAPAAVLSFTPGLKDYGYYMNFPTFMPELAIRNRHAALSALGYSREGLVTTKAHGLKVKGLVIAKVNDRYTNHRVSQALPIVAAVFKNLYCDSSAGHPRRFYVHRRGEVARKVANFEDLKPILDQHHITPIALEELDFEEQVNLFSKADLVLAEHGAGLANSIFMRPGSTMVELFPEPMVGRWMYRAMASAFRLNYCFGAFSVPPGWVWNRDDIQIPPGLVRHILNFLPSP
jgi:hypothetical protein